MENVNFLIWFRYTLASLSVIVALWLILMTARHFKKLDFGQRLWATGAILILLYVADACREAAALGIANRWRLLTHCLGLNPYFAYLQEPRNRKLLRFGKPTFTP
jgi:hypothetical protein